MLSIDKRIDLLDSLGKYMLSDADEWLDTKDRAVRSNPWFTADNIELSVKNIANDFLKEDKLRSWLEKYTLPENTKTVGIVMAGNIPLVGFHDFLCGFITGHNLMLKLSSKDDVLLRHLINKLIEWQPAVADNITVADMLKGCDAYIATGSNNTARYFEQYFAKYPNIIRKNRTSVAVLDGTETTEDLDALMEDVFTYFGLGCRNVTQIYLPIGYDIIKIMEAANKHAEVINHNKYKNNYDYYLAIYLLNKVHYYSNDSLLVVENNIPFSAVGVLHYKYYDDKKAILNELKNSTDIQCVIGHGALAFGSAQSPTLSDYADGIDTLDFLCRLK